MSNTFFDPLELARHWIRHWVPPGGTAVDGTAGRGRDTLFLAETVGSDGKVWAFDVQAEAIEDTAKLLAEHNLSGRAALIQAGHEEIGQYVSDPVHGVMLNLGYLPGGDKNRITLPATTVRALKSGVELLAPGGLITIVVYTGHPGGPDEAGAVEEFVRDLPQQGFVTVRFTYPNRGKTTPYLIVIQKRSMEDSQ